MRSPTNTMLGMFGLRMLQFADINTHGISVVSMLREIAMHRVDTNVVTTHVYEQLLLLLLLQVVDIEWRQHRAASRSDCRQNSHIQR
jgi:hypothetical protein